MQKESPCNISLRGNWLHAIHATNPASSTLISNHPDIAGEATVDGSAGNGLGWQLDTQKIGCQPIQMEKLVNFLFQAYIFQVHLRKLTWQWKIHRLKM